MATIHTRVESSRGCGYRRPGGFYIVLDGEGVVCGLLPVELPEHIKTSRAPSWRESQELLGPSKKRSCSGTEDGPCKECWLKTLPDPEITMLMFVGMSHYKTTQQFEREAGRVGISRKINPGLIPRIHVGHTVVLLAHRESSHIPDEELDYKAIRQIFTAFKPERIEYIVKGNEDEEYLDALEQQGITLIKVQKAGQVLNLGFEAN